MLVVEGAWVKSEHSFHQKSRNLSITMEQS